MQRALDWLDAHEVTGLEAAFAALAVNEAGVRWAGAARALGFEPKTAYERAVLANAVAAWRGPWPAAAPSRQEMLGALLGALTAATDPETGEVTSRGHGLMASWQHQLTVETTALAGVAFRETGQVGMANRAALALIRMRAPGGGWRGTQATAQAVRALTRLVEPPQGTEQPVDITLDAGQGVTRTRLEPGRDRPVTLERALPDAVPGERVTLRVAFKGAEGRHLDSQLALTCLIARPQTSASAPYTIRTELSPKQVGVGGELSLVATVTPTGRPVKGQVAAVIPLPGGTEPDRARLQANGLRATHVAVRDGVVELYWAEPPTGTLRLAIPLRAVAAGRFVTGPASIYPYYVSGQEAYAPGLTLRVARDQDLLEAAAARRQ